MSRQLYISLCLCLCLSLFLSQAKYNHFAASSNLSPPLISPPPENYMQNQNKAPFKPSIAIVVGALTSTFSITFLIFLYVKHCKNTNNGYPNSSRDDVDPYTTQKNSGIDPNVIDLLPVFRFSSLKGQIDGLQCTICLKYYEALEVLRLLPKCKHAFHVECLDTWLGSRSTCPLCRHQVGPEDILLIEHNKTLGVPRHDQSLLIHDHEFTTAFYQYTGRHSSAGEANSNNPNGYHQSTVQKPISSRRSLDSSMKSKIEVEPAPIGCSKSTRKDVLYLASKEIKLEHRVQHQIVVSSDTNKLRWSDVQTSDLLYIRSEMLMTDTRRVSEKKDRREVEVIKGSGRRIITSRKRSDELQQQRREGSVARWLSWISDTSNDTPPPPSISESTSTSIPLFYNPPSLHM